MIFTGLEERTINLSVHDDDDVEISGIVTPFDLNDISISVHLCCRDDDISPDIRFGSDKEYAVLAVKNEIIIICSTISNYRIPIQLSPK